MRLIALIVLIFIPFTVFATGADKVQGRIFGGRHFAEPTDFNAQMSNIGLTDFGTFDKVGFEAEYRLLDLIDLGMRVAINTAGDVAKNGTSAYWTTIHQDVVQLAARVPVITKSFFKFDLMSAYGASNTFVSVSSATQTGHANHTSASGFSTSPVFTYGASVAVGLKGTYAYVEVGRETNTVTGFTRDGTVGSGIDSIDLSGNYWLVGIHFDGSMGASAK